jgi:hypothetical protein
MFLRIQVLEGRKGGVAEQSEQSTAAVQSLSTARNVFETLESAASAGHLTDCAYTPFREIVMNHRDLSSCYISPRHVTAIVVATPTLY